MTELDLSQLRSVAEMATPGPWSFASGDRIIAKSTYDTVCAIKGSNGHRTLSDKPQFEEANAAHIATFDPPTVTRLIDLLTSSRARIAELEGHLHWAVTAADRLAETTPSGVLRTGIHAKADEIRSTLTQKDADRG